MLGYLAAGKARLSEARAIHLHPTQLDSHVVEHLRAQGLEAHAWDVNDAQAFDRATRLGITRCDTDRLELFLATRLELVSKLVK
ncbi:MAG: hypothetical protein HYX56_06790 [Chloroflexi bacterium]|nr:hypothetical protein [Chloroflexota bacterium]